MKSPLWFGDELGVEPKPDGSWEIQHPKIMDIEFTNCTKHGTEIVVRFNTGDYMLAHTLDGTNWFPLQSDGLEEASQEAKEHIRNVIAYELDTLLA